MEGLDLLLERASSVYIVVSPTAVTEPSFPARGYAGASGRLDVVARAMAAPLHAEPEAVSVGVLLGPPRPPVAIAGTSACLGGRERSAVHAIRLALSGRPPSGCWASGEGLEYVLHRASRHGFRVVVLKEDGVDVASAPWALKGRRAYVAGAHVDMPPEQERIVLRYSRGTVSLGPVSLLTSHALAYIAWSRRLLRVCGDSQAGMPG